MPAAKHGVPGDVPQGVAVSTRRIAQGKAGKRKKFEGLPLESPHFPPTEEALLGDSDAPGGAATRRQTRAAARAAAEAKTVPPKGKRLKARGNGARASIQEQQAEQGAGAQDTAVGGVDKRKDGGTIAASETVRLTCGFKGPAPSDKEGTGQGVWGGHQGCPATRDASESAGVPESRQPGPAPAGGAHGPGNCPVCVPLAEGDEVMHVKQGQGIAREGGVPREAPGNHVDSLRPASDRPTKQARIAATFLENGEAVRCIPSRQWNVTWAQPAIDVLAGSYMCTDMAG